MSFITPFFQWFDPKLRKHVEAVLLLERDMPKHLLRDDAEWVKCYRREDKDTKNKGINNKDVNVRTKEQVFELAMGFVLPAEGGYVNHPNDKGGPTNMGITQRVYDSWRKQNGLPPRSVKHITKPEAISIYRNKYWALEAQSYLMHDAIEVVHIDTCVMSGIYGGTTFLEEVFNLPQTGRFGTKLLEHILKANTMHTARSYIAARRAYRYKRVQQDPTQKAFLQGWLNRDDALERYIQTHFD